MTRLTKNVSEPWFSMIATGAKSVEGRLEKGDFKDLKTGTVLVWTNDELGFPRSARTVVKSVARYASFSAYLRGESLSKCLPTVPSLARGVSIYRKYYDAAAEREHGVLAIRLLTKQPIS